MSEKSCTTHHAACDCREAHFARLEGFVREIMDGWPDEGIDREELQHLAEAYGILRPELRTEPCGENCVCLWYCGPEEMAEGVTCMRKAEGLVSKGKTNTGVDK